MYFYIILNFMKNSNFRLSNINLKLLILYSLAILYFLVPQYLLENLFYPIYNIYLLLPLSNFLCFVKRLKYILYFSFMIIILYLFYFLLEDLLFLRNFINNHSIYYFIYLF